MTLRDHILQFLIAADQLVNTLIGGYADETMSARVYRNSHHYWYARAARWALDIVFSPRKRDHCRKAFDSEVTRGHYPAWYRRGAKP